MVAQHYISIGPMYRVFRLAAFLVTGLESVTRIAAQANTGQSPNAVSMSGQRRRRLANIETVFGEWHVFAGVLPQSIQQTQC